MVVEQENVFQCINAHVIQTGSQWQGFVIEYRGSEMQVFVILQEKEMSEDDREVYLTCWISQNWISFTP